MSKIKMRCTNCGKWFQSANAKDVTCPDCMQKARKEKLAAKTAPASSSLKQGQVAQGTVSPAKLSPTPPKSKPTTSGTSQWIDTVGDIKVSEPEQPQRPKMPSSPPPRDTRGGTQGTGSQAYGNYREGGSHSSGGYREERGPATYREGSNRGPGGYRPGSPGVSGGIGQRPRQPMEGGFGRGPRPGVSGEPRPDRYSLESKKVGKPAKAKTLKPPIPPKPKREKIPPPAPFAPTTEQIAQVEARYLELAVPAEFDGIRTQIAQELTIPKKAVKKIVKDLRVRQSIPSWWDLQTYKGDSEELEKIRTIYVPYLPLPPIGVHKSIAEELSLNPGDVYQAIKVIRQEMDLPQYNDPAMHGMEPITGDKKPSATPEHQTKESQQENAETSSTAVETPGETSEVGALIAETSEKPIEVASSTVVDNTNAQE